MYQQVRGFIPFGSKFHDCVVGSSVAAVNQFETGFRHQRNAERRRTVDCSAGFDRLKAGAVDELLKYSRIQYLSLDLFIVRRCEGQKMFVADLVQICQNRLKFPMVKRKVRRDFAWSNNEQLVNVFVDVAERFGPFKDDVDQAHVMVGVQVGQVDGLQISKDFQRVLSAKLSVKLKQCSLSAVEHQKIVGLSFDQNRTDATILAWHTRTGSQESDDRVFGKIFYVVLLSESFDALVNSRNGFWNFVELVDIVHNFFFIVYLKLDVVLKLE